MRWLVFLLLWPQLVVAAQTVIVTDVLPINVRSGVGVGNGIVAEAKSGERLTVLETQPGYFKVRTPKGKEGWVLARFVQNEPVAKELLDDAIQARDSALAEKAEIQQQLSALQAAHQTLIEQHKALTLTSSAAVKELAEVKSTAANALQLKDNNRQLQQRLDAAIRQREEDQFVAKTSALRRSYLILGAGILLVGLLLGLILPFLRPRRSEWAA